MVNLIRPSQGHIGPLVTSFCIFLLFAYFVARLYSSNFWLINKLKKGFVSVIMVLLFAEVLEI